LFKDMDGRESPAMTSLELGINGARPGQATPAERFTGRDTAQAEQIVKERSSTDAN
jgi:hypothetical protein